MKCTTASLPVASSAATTFAATAGAGGFDTTTITFVAASCASASMPMNIVAPPTRSFLRSRPPVPMAWLMPEPARSTSTVTSCSPVPDAATTPTGPRRTTFAKHSGMPPMIAEPQSGPINSRPSSRACSFNAISSSSVTLSEKSITCRPWSSARRASRAAYAPGIEITATFAPGASASAPSSDAGSCAATPPPAPPPPDCPFARAASAAASVAVATAGLSQSTAMTRSAGVTPPSSAAPHPRDDRRSRFSGVPIATTASRTPARPLSSRLRSIRTTESK